jgi:hypothetical protein
MKNLILLSFLFLLIISCQKINDNSKCKYGFSHSPSDTSLFISYQMNGNVYRFYQIIGINHGSENSNMQYNGQTIFIDDYPFSFDNLEFDDTYSAPYVVLTFFDTTMLRSTYPYPGLPIFNSLYPRIKHDYKFIEPKTSNHSTELILEDTVFLRGVSLSISPGDDYYYDLTTETLIFKLNFNKDSLQKYLWSDSFLHIIKSETVCKDFKLVTGEFSTKIMDNSNEYIPIENGRFRIFINK